MEVSVESFQSISPEQLAKSLANASVEDFAEFWLVFCKECTHDALDGFAQAMTPKSGSNRKIVLKRLVKLIEYYEQVEIMQANKESRSAKV